jgi:oligoendopeptidase F
MHKNSTTIGLTVLLVAILVAASGGARGAAHAANAAGSAAAQGNNASAPADEGAAAAAAWRLADLYASPEAWNQAYAQATTEAQGLEHYRGTLSRSSAALYSALDAISTVRRAAARLAVYASLKGDEDLRIASNQERRQQSQRLQTLIDENTAWLAPEILRVGRPTVQRFIAENAQLAHRFDFLLDNTLRAAPHTLGDQAEGVLAAAGTVLQQPQVDRGLLADGELAFPTITLSDGERVQLSSASFTRYREVASRADRKQVFDAFFDAWSKDESTFGGLLATEVMGDWFSASTRHFASSLDSALFPDNMPPTVYHALVEQTHAALPTLYRYLQLRRQLLGIQGPLQYYDAYVPMFALTPEPHFSLQESERLTLAALQPLGSDYVQMLRHGFASQWMDPYPRPGKASGAYMNGDAYEVHPYLLLNETGDYLSLSTLAHEWGHAMHTLLADQAQPYEKSQYSTFIAETASIGNEMLLNDYMVDHAHSKAEKLYYLGEGLESIRTTFFRQVLFAEFELKIHQQLEQGQPLSGESMTRLYCDLLRTYYGEAQGIMHIDPRYCIEWAYVPHFYYDFYVYQYATSMAGAASMTDAILEQGASARARYFKMLRAGGSDYPYQLYRQAGIDMATPAPYRALMARMNRIMDQIEQLEAQN